MLNSLNTKGYRYLEAPPDNHDAKPEDTRPQLIPEPFVGRPPECPCEQRKECMALMKATGRFINVRCNSEWRENKGEEKIVPQTLGKTEWTVYDCLNNRGPSTEDELFVLLPQYKLLTVRKSLSLLAVHGKVARQHRKHQKGVKQVFYAIGNR